MEFKHGIQFHCSADSHQLWHQSIDERFPDDPIRRRAKVLNDLSVVQSKSRQSHKAYENMLKTSE
jgi:hypothetical protein